MVTPIYPQIGAVSQALGGTGGNGGLWGSRQARCSRLQADPKTSRHWSVVAASPWTWSCGGRRKGLWEPWMDARGGLPALWGNEGALRRAEGLEVSRQGRGGGVQGHPTAPHAYPAHSSEHPGGRGGHRHPCPSDGCPLHGWSWPHRGVLTPQRGPKLLGGSIRPLSVGPHAIGGQPHSRVPDPQRGPTHGQNSPTEGSSPRRWVLKPRGEASATECPTARSPPH